MKNLKDEIKVGYGILTKNPDEVTESDFKHYRPLSYVKYNGRWYLIRNNENIDYIYKYLKLAKDSDDLYKRLEKLIYGFKISENEFY